MNTIDTKGVTQAGVIQVIPAATDVVRQFWALMASNDFSSVGAVLSDDFLLDWPQSNERIRGKDNFARMNAEYPCNGRWIFTINQLLGNDVEVVSDVSITDGVQHPHAISFFTVVNGKITAIREYWPEPYPAPANRRHLVEQIR
ncbi:nuclear transport factor 2 family protein [Undibacterium sp. RuTC16W]|uniref:nuclear transport factor 2 family protein n=1 Tax=Undibacterium sp. RuTC16W TaxID=3413048 RepID=UPI003BF2FBD0